MNIVRLFSASVARHGADPALIAGRGRGRQAVSYRELAGRVDRAVGRLSDSGLEPGDRVLLAVPLSVESYVAMLAVLKAGMVVMFVDPGRGRSAVGACLDAYPPDAVIGTRATLWARHWLPALKRIPRRFSVPLVGGCGRRRPRAPLRVALRAPGDPALLTFTSGSTGQAKAVVRSHGLLLEQFRALRPLIDRCADDVELVTMPMFVLFNLARGTTSVLPAARLTRPGRASPRRLAAQLDEVRATRLLASPALLERLVIHCEQSGTRLDTLRRVATGGGPLPPALSDRLASIAPGATVRVVYGSTEAEPISFIDSDAVSIEDATRMREGAGLLVGRPVRGCAVRIIDDRYRGGRPLSPERFEALMRPPGRVGEIVVAGRHVLDRYPDPSYDAALKLDVDGTRWHRTGDAGYVDAGGRLWLAGRVSAVIRDRRGELGPFQVEFAASALPGIRRAALLAHRGQRVLVVETYRMRFSTCRERLARCIAKWEIDRLVPVKRIPVDRRHGAKVDYPALGRLLRRRLRHAD